MTSIDHQHPNEPLASVAMQATGSRLLATVSGELDMSNAGDVASSLLAAADGFDTLTLDISAVEFLDSHALARLHQLHQDLTSVNTHLVVVTGVDTIAARTIHLAGMDEVLPTSGLITPPAPPASPPAAEPPTAPASR